MDTDQLIAGCRAGDVQSIEVLVQHYEKAVYKLALSILDDRAEAEEATQDALVAALGKLDSYRGDSSFKTWLFSITINLCRSRLRKRQARRRLIQMLQYFYRFHNETESHPEEAAILMETQSRLWHAVQSLGENHRLPVILRYYHELPIATIAEILGIHEGTVHSRLNTARTRLQSILTEFTASDEEV